MDNESLQFQKAAQAWLFEMNLINNPQAVNVLKLNVLMVSKHIKECEILMSIEHSSILVWLDVPNRFIRWWLGEKGLKLLCGEAEEVVRKLLPSFRVRVVEDKSIYDLAVKRVEEVLKGGSDEVPSNSSSPSDADGGSSEGLSETSDILPNPGEPSED